MEKPAFLDRDRPDVPDLVVPGGVTPFYLAGRPVRGRLVRLGVLADTLLTRHDHPAPVTRLAGKALALVAALASALKFQGSFSLQIKGDGPVSMLVADCTNTGALRFYARTDDEALETLLAETPKPTDRELLGDGYMALTVDQGPEMDRHQGIVEIAGDDLSAMAMHYFASSEQHACWIMLACQMTDAGWRAGGLILERIAGEGGSHVVEDEAAEASWETATILADTLSTKELLDDSLPTLQLLHRLFHEEDLHVSQPRALAFGCRCSRARLANVLETFPQDDLDHMCQDDGNIVMTCEFCNVDFRFARKNIATQTQ
ncbi:MULTISPECIES: Hsp33 family molecular chaperone HslO [Acetobacter]|uniref:33 kDa chaperonin n=3 Tax=Acetobacter TaxID=434 RepID=F1YTD2_9PROT|nr:MULTISPECIES: Hsp33 family molecular chaperone HslO [Acetobacter]ASL39690.1 heat-shock protein Hsp33 [Acetobacter oryzifermentans]ATI11671.1 heat-shock protein Hsp33 [Acetobacter pomorum]AXC25994.1 Hsp33 family molecular chaperone HslO [Acetobacter sp. JWB]AXN00881.1 heat-shock protein Hsp33 [Acetobacter pomorum]EGE48156.1 33 kDa chaperonin [Acetobacter pomorum DM001]